MIILVRYKSIQRTVNSIILACCTYAGYIEAPMFGKSAMEDSYPWSTEITKQQAMLFMSNYRLTSEYYQKVRYNK